MMDVSMHSADPAGREDAGEWLGVEDEELVTRSSARLLITASTQQAVEALARHVHRRRPGEEFPFVHVDAADLPADREILQDYCTCVLAAAAGGSILISAVEQMSPTAQLVLVELLAAPEFASRATDDVRLISGTTVSLFERVAAGTFSERLFYRLNVIHLVVGTTG